MSSQWWVEIGEDEEKEGRKQIRERWTEEREISFIFLNQTLNYYIILKIN